MAIALELIDFDPTRRKIKRIYRATLSGDYVALGMPIDFTLATNPKYLECSPAPGYGISMSDDKVQLEVDNNGNGYMFRTEKGTDFTNSLFRIFESGADGGDLDEIAAAALPAAVSDDTNIIITLTTPVGF